MHNKFYTSLGLWIAILPFLGIPGTWRYTLVTISGVFLALVSIGPSILKKLQAKPKVKKKQEKMNFQNTTIPKSDLEGKLRFSAPDNNKENNQAGTEEV